MFLLSLVKVFDIHLVFQDPAKSRLVGQCSTKYYLHANLHDVKWTCVDLSNEMNGNYWLMRLRLIIQCFYTRLFHNNHVIPADMVRSQFSAIHIIIKRSTQMRFVSPGWLVTESLFYFQFALNFFVFIARRGPLSPITCFRACIIWIPAARSLPHSWNNQDIVKPVKWGKFTSFP